MYHVSGDTQLRVVRGLVKSASNRDALRKCRLVILEHLLPTTAELVRLLAAGGAHISAIIAKPYSVDPETEKKLRAQRYRVIRKNSYEEIDRDKVCARAIDDALQESRKDGRKIVVVDVGGYFAEKLSTLTTAQTEIIAGVVEDTTFGHNIYRRRTNDIPVPVCSVARSELKEIEGRFVGRDAVVAIESLLRRIGISITGRNALVIGYGMIGKNVARTLRGYDLNVYVYDIEDRKLVHAFNDGFHVHKKQVVLRSADIIFSATGSESLGRGSAMTLGDIEDCKHGVILASVGSKRSEFAVDDLQAQAVEARELLHGARNRGLLTCYKMSNSKDVIVACNGTAVNFSLPTLAIEILDLVFAEIVESILALWRGEWVWTEGRAVQRTRRTTRLRTRTVNLTPGAILDRISKDWLRSVNMEAQA